MVPTGPVSLVGLGMVVAGWFGRIVVGSYINLASGFQGDNRHFVVEWGVFVVFHGFFAHFF